VLQQGLKTSAALGLCIVGLGAISWMAWFGEVTLLIGWDGLRWLAVYPKAAFVGVACAAISVLLPARAERRLGVRRAGLFFLVASFIALVSFHLARSSIYALHSRSAAFMILAGERSMARLFIAKHVARLAASAVLTAGGFALAMGIVRRHAGWRMAQVFLLALLLVMPMGALTIRVFPTSQGYTDYIHVVKMGYPLFWTTVLMGVASWIGARRSGRQPTAGDTSAPSLMPSNKAAGADEARSNNPNLAMNRKDVAS
jgi:hypothetical protein